MEFFNTTAEIKKARQGVEAALLEAYSDLTQAKMMMGPARVKAFIYASMMKNRLNIKTRLLMGVRVPVLSVE